MYYELFAIVLGIAALVLAFFFIIVMKKIFETENIQPFAFALLMLLICEVMIIFLLVLSIIKLTGIA